jgi:hypothetical protein
VTKIRRFIMVLSVKIYAALEDGRTRPTSSQ